MINDFLAHLDRLPTAPSDFAWPTGMRSETTAQAMARRLLLPADLPREWRFRRACRLLAIVMSSSLADKIQARDSRLTYTLADLRQRLRPGPYSAAFVRGQATPVRPFLMQAVGCDGYLDALLQFDGQKVQVTDSDGKATVTAVTFTNGLSQILPLPLLGTSCRITSAFATGDTWRIRRWSDEFWLSRLQQVLLPAVRSQEMTDDVRDVFITQPTAQEKLAAACVWLAS